MIKKMNKWLYGAMALSMFAACSSDDAPNNKGGKEPIFQGDGYLAVKIQLPQQPSTRGLNDKYADGTANEYKVDNGYLVLYSGENEATATIAGVYELSGVFKNNEPNDPNDTNNSDNITSSSVTAVKVESLEETTNLYGLVLLNIPSDGFTITTGGTSGKIEVAGAEVKTFGDLQSTISAASFYISEDNASHFFMTNAPLSSIPGGTSKPVTPEVKTLVNLSGQLYDDAEEAKAHPSACIFVERAVAKITSTFNPEVSIKVKDGVSTIDNLEASAEYVVDNYNTNSYVVRNVSGMGTDFAWDLNNENATLDKYRMIGSVAMPKLTDPYHPEQIDLYRTYWCKDPNYNGTTTYPLTTSLSPIFSSLDKPLYCKENTFDVANQTWGNTTRVIYKVTYKIGNTATDLYILNGQKNVVYTSESDVTSLGKAYICSETAIETAIKAALKDGVSFDKEEMASFIKVTYEADEDGILKATTITLDEDAKDFNTYFDENSVGNFDTALTQEESILQAVNKEWVITKYTGGVSYYDVLVKHFGDESTPWAETVGTIPNIVYGTGRDAANNYLGRYGLVRNNWYDLSVKSLTGLGSPTVPSIETGLSDDSKKNEKYIGIEVHTLSWAKRTQSVVF